MTIRRALAHLLIRAARRLDPGEATVAEYRDALERMRREQRGIPLSPECDAGIAAAMDRATRPTPYTRKVRAGK